jgi:hypothetical protein
VTGAAPGPGVIVLGMHRSGTSAVTRLLNLLGADVGPEDDLVHDFDNPAGHWESRSLVSANDRILSVLGRSWDFPPRLAPGWERTEEMDGLVPELADTFASVYRSCPWVWKDPRTCLTLPLWRRVLGDAPRIVYVRRDPAAVVHSVFRRDGVPRLYATGLWHRYVHAALQGAAGLGVVCVRFEDVVGDPATSVDLLADRLATLGVPLPGDRAAAAASIAGDPPATRRAPVVRRLTSEVDGVVGNLPAVATRFVPPRWREPSWVRPFLFAYRATWAARARHGHPLRGAPARRREVAP